jgi:hypothetical protein
MFFFRFVEINQIYFSPTIVSKKRKKKKNLIFFSFIKNNVTSTKLKLNFFCHQMLNVVSLGSLYI